MHERLGLYRVVVLLFIALAIGVLTSVAVVALGPSFALSAKGEWTGIFQHKNVLGLSAAMMTYTGLVLAKRYWLLVFPILVLAATALVQARSATSLVALCVAVAVLPAALILRLRFYSFAAAGSFLVAAVALAAGWALVGGTSLVEDLLGALERDDTLTGRSDLWDFGWEAFLAHPILGLGYKAYWISDETSAAYLRYFVRQDLWYFHNNLLEVAVATGLVGVGIFIAGLLQVVVLVIRANRRTPGVPATWSLMFLAHVLILCAVENPLFYNHSLAQILFVAIAAAAIKVPDEAERRPTHPLPSMTSAAALGAIARTSH
jgi:O-antigen ligase